MGGPGSSTRSDVLLGLTPEVPTAARVTMTAITLGRFQWLTLALLTAWVILGPVGMAFHTGTPFAQLRLAFNSRPLCSPFRPQRSIRGSPSRPTVSPANLRPGLACYS